VYYVETGFFPCFTEGAFSWCFASINVSTWLQPHIESLMQVQHYAAVANNNS
jgi:hypothetical protein